MSFHRQASFCGSLNECGNSASWMMLGCVMVTWAFSSSAVVLGGCGVMLHSHKGTVAVRKTSSLPPMLIAFCEEAWSHLLSMLTSVLLSGTEGRSRSAFSSLFHARETEAGGGGGAWLFQACDESGIRIGTTNSISSSRVLKFTSVFPDV